MEVVRNEKQRIEENIFAKLELRRDVLHSIHRRIEECSQLRSRYTLVFDNYMSMQEDKEALATLSEQEIGDMRDECDRLKVQLEQQRLQLDGDITNYITNTRQFILDCYTYVRTKLGFNAARKSVVSRECEHEHGVDESPGCSTESESPRDRYEGDDECRS